MMKFLKKGYIKNAGIGLFLFFFLKGLAWIAVFYFGINIFSRCS